MLRYLYLTEGFSFKESIPFMKHIKYLVSVVEPQSVAQYLDGALRIYNSVSKYLEETSET